MPFKYSCFISYRHGQKKLTERVINDLNEALGSELEKNEQSFSAYLDRGQSQLRLGAYAQATSDFDKVIYSQAADAKTLAAALRGKGEALLRQDKLDEAIAQHTQSIQLDPDSDVTYLYRAAAYQKKGDEKAAIADYQQALTLTRDDQIKDRATLGLIQLGALSRLVTTPTLQPSVVPTVAASPTVNVTTRIYLQYQNRNDLPVVNEIRKALTGLGRVQEPEWVAQPTFGAVRYFYQEDQTSAERIRQAAQASLRQQGFSLGLALSYTRGYSAKVPRGWVEIWLPSLRGPEQDKANQQNVQQSRPASRATAQPTTSMTPNKRLPPVQRQY